MTNQDVADRRFSHGADSIPPKIRKNNPCNCIYSFLAAYLRTIKLEIFVILQILLSISFQVVSSIFY